MEMGGMTVNVADDSASYLVFKDRDLRREAG
jgi:hypothetical protein